MKDSSWQQSLLVVCIAGFWIGALVAFCRALLAHLFSLMPYSLPLLIMEAGIACNVAFWVSPMVHEPKMVWAFCWVPSPKALSCSLSMSDTFCPTVGQPL